MILNAVGSDKLVVEVSDSVCGLGGLYQLGFCCRDDVTKSGIVDFQ